MAITAGLLTISSAPFGASGHYTDDDRGTTLMWVQAPCAAQPLALMAPTFRLAAVGSLHLSLRTHVPVGGIEPDPQRRPLPADRRHRSGGDNSLSAERMIVRQCVQLASRACAYDAKLPRLGFATPYPPHGQAPCLAGGQTWLRDISGSILVVKSFLRFDGRAHAMCA